MELVSQSTAQALEIGGQSNEFTDESFETFVNHAIECILGTSGAEEKPFQNVDPALLKQTYPAMMTLFVEAAKTDAGADQLNMILDDCKMPAKRKEFVLEAYKSNKQKLRANLSLFRNSLPHVVDADWKLDYNLKNSQLNKVMELQYTVALKTDQSERQDVQFSCTREQLQDLVGKLKEAVKAVERASQN